MRDTPVYHCHRTPIAPSIDGVLDASWQCTEAVSLVENCCGQRPQQATEARMMWDDRALYVAFSCEDSDIWGDMVERNSPIYEQQVVEVFLDADSDGRGYVELEISPLNTVLDLYMLCRGSNRKGLWDWECCGLESAVHVEGDPCRRGTEDHSWTVEVAIPFTELLTAPHCPPEPGDSWRVNLYRIDRPMHGDWELSAWSPTGREDFHLPERFGQLIFIE